MPLKYVKIGHYISHSDYTMNIIPCSNNFFIFNQVDMINYDLQTCFLGKGFYRSEILITLGLEGLNTTSQFIKAMKCFGAALSCSPPVFILYTL